MIKRTFNRANLFALNLPPEAPTDVEHREDLHVDEFVKTLKYGQLRRCIFTHPDGRTYAVEYEAPIDTGDFEMVSDVEACGWKRSVTAIQVERRMVAADAWMPVVDGHAPDPDQGADPAQHHLTEVYTESGCRDDVARAAAALLLGQHARELARLLEEKHPGAACDLRGYAADLDRPYEDYR